MVKRFKDIVRLMQRAQWEELNKTEQSELHNILQNKDLYKIWQQVCDNEYVANRLEEYTDFSAKKAYRQFCREIRGGQPRIIKRYWAVAAAIVVMGIGVAFFLNRMVFLPEADPVTANCLVEPGSRKPTLRLANGQLVGIEKDTMKILEKDGTEIQYADGVITYTTSEKVNELVYNELIIPIAGECYIVLEDGTRVWINADSKLKYPVKFTGAERRIFLEGEAYFDVAKNGKPFWVNTAYGNVWALGTSFNIKAYRKEDKMLATLVSGSICFEGKEKVMLQPGEQVTALKDGTWAQKKVDVEEYVSWKEGWFIFKNRRLEDIMTELERWYGVKVFYRQQALKDIEYTGNLKRYDHIEVMLELLKLTNEINYSINGNTIIFYQ